MALGDNADSLTGYLGKATRRGREIHSRSGAVMQDVVHYTGSGANDDVQGDDIECAELLVMAHPDNAGRVWVRTGEAATTSNAWPLDAGEIFSFNVENLSDLQMLIVTSGEKIIVAYA